MRRLKSFKMNDVFWCLLKKKKKKKQFSWKLSRVREPRERSEQVSTGGISTGSSKTAYVLDSQSTTRVLMFLDIV